MSACIIHYVIIILLLQLWRSFYTIVMMVLAFASLFAQTHSQFLSSHWYVRRLVLYSAFLFAGIVPVVHWIVHNGGLSDPLVQVSVMINVYSCTDFVFFFSSFLCPRFLWCTSLLLLEVSFMSVSFLRKCFQVITETSAINFALCVCQMAMCLCEILAVP